MARKKTTLSSTPITSHKHGDKRKNIPTEELRDFVADDERQPKTVLYPRDPSLDPQLVWRGKDEQDQQDLAVPAVPVYIQEKIQPQVIIENVRQSPLSQPGRGGGGEGYQMSLFDDFNGLEFDELVDFYQHEQSWTNRMILGDSLMVMNSLAEKEGLKGQVQMIYIDPPYGIKFGSNWQVSTRKRSVKDGRAEDTTRQPEQVKAFRDTWQLGIHSYLAYLRDRLMVARELLTESGSIFVQIGDENVHLVRNILDEVYGSENFISLIAYRTSIGLGAEYLDNVSNYLIWYGKNREAGVKYRPMLKELTVGEKGATRYNYAQSLYGEQRFINDEDLSDPSFDSQEWLLFTDQGLTSRTGSVTTTFPFEYQGKIFKPTAGGWRTNLDGMKRVELADRIQKAGDTIRYKKFFFDFGCIALTNQWDDVSGGIASRSDPKIYVVQTSTEIIKRCLLMTTDPGDLVLDPTCGSGTTAYVAEQWGRRWITIDTSRVALALARTRLMAGRYPYYLLADSPEGQRKEAEITGTLPSPILGEGSGMRADIKKGFVYKRVPHITLKSIANNEEIDAIHEKWQPDLEALRGEINRLAGKRWEEWEIPRLPSPYQTEKERLGTEKVLKAAGIAPGSTAWQKLEAWWDQRRLRQKEIDDSIARRADTEMLYDQPYEDGKRIRVSGPFTVESLSPHRVLSTDEERPEAEKAGQKQPGPGQFETMILENLKASGVQNTIKNERLKFTSLEPYAGTWIQAEGEYEEKTGIVRRAAVAIGPEHGTVGPDLVKEAAKEAVLGVGFDLLVVCGFAFDPHVSEEARRYGKLTVLPTRMNPDLAMGDELLKKTGSGNLFMVFGEPDVEIEGAKDGRITVTIRGVDVYDPTTGEIRSSSTDDIACWFIDTNYNGESFFVRHAYFTGADEPYDRLKRALRAEINEQAWSALYSTTSYPFDQPETGKIAVKVINHYGDEVLKVYEC